ncbi:MAG: hypothetical protein WCN21_05265 [Comamonadaceae bacterium]
MTYRRAFDRLGNQVQPPKPDWQHRAIQGGSVATIVVCLFILLWVR